MADGADSAGKGYLQKCGAGDTDTDQLPDGKGQYQQHYAMSPTNKKFDPQQFGQI